MGAKLLLALMLCATTAAFTLAYYSIQIGELSIGGIVNIWDVVAAFGVAAAQLGMPLWVAHVARGPRMTLASDIARQGAPWLLFGTAFAACATLGSARAAARRRPSLTSAPEWWQKFEAEQRSDRWYSALTSAFLFASWIASAVLAAHEPYLAQVFLVAGAVGALVAFVLGIRSQHMTAKGLTAGIGTFHRDEMFGVDGC